MNININNSTLTRQCFCCHTVLPLTEKHFYKSKTRKLGFEYRCKNCEKFRENRKPSKKLPNILNRIHTRYKASDKLEQREFGLTLEFVRQTVIEPCSYCGTPNSMGLDRLDNDLGHTNENCVPCCSICNYVRSNEFTPEEMKELGKVIAKIRISRIANEQLILN